MMNFKFLFTVCTCFLANSHAFLFPSITSNRFKEIELGEFGQRIRSTNPSLDISLENFSNENFRPLLVDTSRGRRFQSGTLRTRGRFQQKLKATPLRSLRQQVILNNRLHRRPKFDENHNKFDVFIKVDPKDVEPPIINATSTANTGNELPVGVFPISFVQQSFPFVLRNTQQDRTTNISHLRGRRPLEPKNGFGTRTKETPLQIVGGQGKNMVQVNGILNSVETVDDFDDYFDKDLVEQSSFEHDDYSVETPISFVQDSTVTNVNTPALHDNHDKPSKVLVIIENNKTHATVRAPNRFRKRPVIVQSLVDKIRHKLIHGNKRPLALHKIKNIQNSGLKVNSVQNQEHEEPATVLRVDKKFVVNKVHDARNAYNLNPSKGYHFSYEVDDHQLQYGHAENRSGNVVYGEYHVLLPNGYRQIVTYYADATGYHPTVRYEPPVEADPMNVLNSIEIGAPLNLAHDQHQTASALETRSLPITDSPNGPESNSNSINNREEFKQKISRTPNSVTHFDEQPQYSNFKDNIARSKNAMKELSSQFRSMINKSENELKAYLSTENEKTDGNVQINIFNRKRLPINEAESKTTSAVNEDEETHQNVQRLFKEDETSVLPKMEKFLIIPCDGISPQDLTSKRCNHFYRHSNPIPSMRVHMSTNPTSNDKTQKNKKRNELLSANYSLLQNSQDLSRPHTGSYYQHQNFLDYISHLQPPKRFIDERILFNLPVDKESFNFEMTANNKKPGDSNRAFFEVVDRPAEISSNKETLEPAVRNIDSFSKLARGSKKRNLHTNTFRLSETDNWR